ncbi:hypothetical protein N5U17_10630 [Aliarcobacter butzleri]|uniref:hypothetical protein n=1 Tax=Aliarcobacter butzleri TaxID=28197 RepID=UPI0021B33689|nr:hypothetical protein [Aliarcobacter butzleri]MCT7604689.1 hypothetical protein [Aliarcobacter butzleri]
MLTLKGILLNIIDKSEYKKDGESLATPVKAKLQILVDEKRANGSITKVLHTISIPDEKIVLYKDKVSKEISVDVAIISKQFGFYGV